MKILKVVISSWLILFLGTCLLFSQTSPEEAKLKKTVCELFEKGEYDKLFAAAFSDPVQKRNFCKTKGKILKVDMINGEPFPLTQFENLDFQGGHFGIGAQYELPYANKENVIPFQRLLFVKPNALFSGPPLFPGLPVAYPKKLEGVQAEPSDLLSGALGIVFLEKDGSIGAFMPLAIELPAAVKKLGDDPNGLSSVKEFKETYDALKNLTPNFELARTKGKRIEKFNSTSPTNSEFVKWPEKLPLKTVGLLVFVSP